MSRSYRKPIATEGYGSKTKRIRKKQANKAVKQEAEISNGKAYRKVYNPWNICDYKFKLEDTKKNRRK